MVKPQKEKENATWHIVLNAALPVLGRVLAAVGLTLLVALGQLPPGAERCLALVVARQSGS